MGKAGHLRPLREAGSPGMTAVTNIVSPGFCATAKEPQIKRVAKPRQGLLPRLSYRATMRLTDGSKERDGRKGVARPISRWGPLRWLRISLSHLTHPTVAPATKTHSEQPKSAATVGTVRPGEDVPYKWELPGRFLTGSASSGRGRSGVMQNDGLPNGALSLDTYVYPKLSMRLHLKCHVPSQVVVPCSGRRQPC
ncbi:hypothetical protein M433DRAFT_450098 [Acidomyces richmondensis BFW]|nr:MAG: hypothetical protein FE78DRAFT_263596 [Acidomyces sp. 'richmondensis']KYG41852.1 hypothetical protein M433DRAFT_450098 [Acidomyces richmondensis BFW]